jgi:prophage antirepressor-like protein
MSHDIIPFHFHDREVLTIRDDQGDPWWRASDVCEHCGILNVSQACERLDTDEKAVICLTDTTGRSQDMLIVNEPGLYRLVMRSRKAAAKEFQRWVTHEVLPSIRKTGKYDATQVPQVKNPVHQLMIDTVIRLDEVEQRAIAAEERAIRAEARIAAVDTKADLALEDAHTMSLEDYIMKNGLLRQFPQTQWSRYATWLVNFCLATGMHVSKIPVYGKQWSEENVYPLGALHAWKRQEVSPPRQVHLLRPQGSEGDAL